MTTIETTQNQTDDQFEDIDSAALPDEGDVKVQGNFPSAWGFVASQENRTATIQTGSKEKGTLQTKERMVGRLKAITIRTWLPDAGSDKKPSQHLAATLVTRDGDVSLETWLSDFNGNLDTPTGPTIAFAWALLQMAWGELVCFTCSLGDKQNEFKKYPLFVNGHTVDAQNNAKRVKSRPKTDKDMAGTWEDFKAQLKTHPAWVEPVDPRSVIRPDTHLAELCKESKAKGWPTPQEEPGKWLAMLAAATSTAPADMLRDVDDDVWGQLRQHLTERTECPKALLPVVVGAIE